ncbi:Proline racemase [Nostocoides japonicum T1-X7]|uniref:Proline racemase n=1 Tax=Nostocoides japonicum T1-X7 TaxID=1194083 RepID=A0A077LSM8_9MICO|nr:proline racemase family protein [Tetrasphaera japonica]CCH76008.1 Proline racemase [Tetrasphaera japonica T1-X7]
MPIAATIEWIDVHAEGEPGRVVLAHDLGVEGATMAERLAWCERNLEGLRRLLLHEPRGYPALCAVLALPPVTPGSDVGLVIVEQGGFRPMSGSNTICAVTGLLEAGVIPMTEPETVVRIDTAAGPVEARARVRGSKVTSVQVHNVPSFVVGLDVPVSVVGYGEVAADIAFGGQFYVQAPAASLGVELGIGNERAIVRAAMGLLASAREQVPVRHPLEPSIDQIALVMLHGPGTRPGVDGRNSVVLPTGPIRGDDPDSWRGSLDRSPCGTGTSARMACRHARGQLAIGEPFVHEGVLGTTFTGMLHGQVDVAGIPAVLPSIEGRGWRSGRGSLHLDPTDPFQEGYTLADIWGVSQVASV